MAVSIAESVSDRRKVVLASQSPRRRHLLSTLGIDAAVVVSAVDEEAVIISERLSGHDPESFVRTLAERKAVDVADRSDVGSALVIGADTVVVYAEQILGKPTDLRDARRMLTMVSGDWVRVVSGVVVVDTVANTVVHRTVTTACRVDDLDESTVERYLATEVWTDKAGGLAVQHRDPQLIAAVDGCWASVAGFPICEVGKILVDHGIPIDPAAGCPGVGTVSCTLADSAF